MHHIPIYVGFDPREAAAFHVFNQSVIETASVPIAIHPLHSGLLGNFDGQKDGTNAFIYSRFLVPYLQDFRGWAIFADGDMTCLADIADLWAYRERSFFNKAVCVVKHDYQTKNPRKYIGTPIESDNTSYPRKNWSSIILWNCSHYSNRILTPEFVAQSPGSLLHRFGWLNDNQIGELPVEWNHLEGEYPYRQGVKLVHHTLGVPGIDHYKNSDYSGDWLGARGRSERLG